jgi:hypothetical protein
MPNQANKLNFKQTIIMENPVEENKNVTQESNVDNVVKGIFNNLIGDPNAPESEQVFDAAEFAQFAGSLIEGLGLGQKIKDAITPEAESGEEKPMNNYTLNLTFGDIRFK